MPYRDTVGVTGDRRYRSTIINAKNCFYCDREFTATGGTLKTKDHIIPVTLGGTNRERNYVDACFDCNQLKAYLSLSEFIGKVERKIRSKKECLQYTKKQLAKIIDNCKILIKNCVGVYGKQLFIDKWHYQDYQEKNK